MAGRMNILNLGPYEGWKGWVRGLVITLVAAGFLTFADAFGVTGAPLARLAYWLGLMLGGFVWGAFVSSRFFPTPAGRKGSLWRRAGLASLAIAGPFTIVVGLVTWRLFGTSFNTPARLANLAGTVLAITLIMVFLNTLVERQAQGFTDAAAEGSPPPKFWARLPARLKDAELWAVEAEDHYLRLHTSKGQDLILMRLSDAVGELQGLEGAQVHRSWWVARAAISQVERGDGRARITLADGARVPVSRTHARRLRELGWI